MNDGLAQGGYAAHVARLAGSQGTRPALASAGGPALDYAGLARRIAEVRLELAQSGVQPGMLLAWPTADRLASAAALAILPGHCTIAPLDPSLSQGAYAALLARLKPAAVVVPSDRAHPIATAAEGLGIARIDLDLAGDDTIGGFRLAGRGERTPAERIRLVDPDVLAVSATSGSTGRPKLVPHAWRALVVASRAVGERLAIGPDDVSAHMTPLFLANGLRNAFMLALVHGASVRVLPEADPEAFLAAIDAGEVTYTSASFAIQREVLRRLETGCRVRARRLRFVRVASGAMAADEMDRLEQALGVPVLSGLSASETGTIALQRLPPARRTRGTCGDALGAELRVAGDDGQALPAGATGEIRVRGPQVFAGYLDDDALNAASFVDGWFATGDLGRIDERGDLVLAGRLREMINRGGEKVSPAEIDAILRALPGVADAAAFALPHPRLGQEIGAAVVRAAGSDLDAARLLARVRECLGTRRAPKHLWFVGSLPRAGNGKLARHLLPALVGFETGVALDGGGATPLEAAIAGLWSSVLGDATPPGGRTFAESGGDERLAERLRGELQTVFGVDLDFAAHELAQSRVADLARVVGDARGGGNDDA